jgi:hypothetical protein
MAKVSLAKRTFFADKHAERTHLKVGFFTTWIMADSGVAEEEGVAKSGGNSRRAQANERW